LVIENEKEISAKLFAFFGGRGRDCKIIQSKADQKEF